MPVFGLLERIMIKRLNFSPGIVLRLVARSAFVGEIPITLSLFRWFPLLV